MLRTPTALIVVLPLLAGCLGPASPKSEPGPDPPELTMGWGWSTPPSSGLYEAAVLVHPAPEPIRVTYSFEGYTPTPNGDFLDMQGTWELKVIAGGIGTWGVPTYNSLAVRAAGQNLVNQRLPEAPSVIPNRWETGGSPIHPPTPDRPYLLLIHTVLMIDPAQEKPFVGSVHVAASTNRLQAVGEQELDGAFGCFYMSKGDFDGKSSTRLRAGITDVAMVTGHQEFETKNYTLISGDAVLEGPDGAGLGSIRLRFTNSQGEYVMEAGGVGRNPYIYPYFTTGGDHWTVDAEFTGEGYLLLCYADIPVLLSPNQ